LQFSLWRPLCDELSSFLLFFLFPAFAVILTNLRGVVHDPQHKPVVGARITLQSKTSDFHQDAATNDSGIFEFSAIPAGEYTVTVDAPGFASQAQAVVLTSGTAPILHFPLEIATLQQKVDVIAAMSGLDAESSTRTSLINREQISRYAGADGTNSFRFVTDFVPGAYMVHDQLHVRGGHQVTWAIDGVPLPNTNIASNVGPQFNPKDVDYLEAQNGSFSADYGDRTYGVFNVATRTGFERNREAELVTSYGTYNATDDQLSFGDHTEKFAYYVSGNGNRSDYGLEPPTSRNLHNQASGGGAFTSLIYNTSPRDQLRFNGGFRADYYQVPNDADMQESGVRDRQREQDGFATLTWARSFSARLLLTISPFYHFNRAAFEGGKVDVPSATDNRASNYEGGQLSLSYVQGPHNARGGLYAFGQQDTSYFSLIANDGSGLTFRQTVKPGGNLEALYLEDQYKITSWLTLNGGIRLTHFAGLLNENAADPRVGAAIRIPVIGAVLRGSYSRFYQAPPLDTVSGPLEQFALQQGLTFLPLHGERDEQHEAGLALPLRGWIADLSYFRTGAHNYFDHDVIGNSNIFLPLTIHSARIRAYEATLRSPVLWHRMHAHLVYSNQQTQGFGGTTGGLTDFSPPAEGGFYLDHDQRNTLAAGADGDLPWRSFASLDLNYGSGFLKENGPAHLPSYRTIDMSLGKNFAEGLSVRLSATNLTNKRYQLDTSNAFGGSHFADARMLSVQLRYRFPY
jgi:outer membrane receptor protein involved in Fe transport